VLTGGQERTEEEYARLCCGSDGWECGVCR
jgi:hypothetical protein